MHLPNFTAENSLYRNTASYCTVTRLSVGADSLRIAAGFEGSLGTNWHRRSYSRLFCRPGCSDCEEVAPGRWEQECITPGCQERTQPCQPQASCGPCVPDAGS